MDKVEFRLNGDDLQFVEIALDPGEAVIGEAGSMMFTHRDIEMTTIFGDGSNNDSGVFNSLFKAGKRALAGENLFTTVYTNNGGLKRTIAFAAPYIGKIIPIDLSAYGGKMICQKDAFLCAAKGVEIGMRFQKRLGAGFFGGAGFVLQTLEGDGMAFIHSCGALVKKELGETGGMLVDPGCVVAFTEGVDFDIQYIGNIKSALFGGEGIFLAKLSGPGEVWLQSLPFSRLASRVFAAAPQLPSVTSGNSSNAAVSLGALGGILGGISNSDWSSD